MNYGNHLHAYIKYPRESVHGFNTSQNLQLLSIICWLPEHYFS